MDRCVECGQLTVPIQQGGFSENAECMHFLVTVVQIGFSLKFLLPDYIWTIFDVPYQISKKVGHKGFSFCYLINVSKYKFPQFIYKDKQPFFSQKYLRYESLSHREINELFFHHLFIIQHFVFVFFFLTLFETYRLIKLSNVNKFHE